MRPKRLARRKQLRSGTRALPQIASTTLMSSATLASTWMSARLKAEHKQSMALGIPRIHRQHMSLPDRLVLPNRRSTHTANATLSFNMHRPPRADGGGTCTGGGARLSPHTWTKAISMRIEMRRMARGDAMALVLVVAIVVDACMLGGRADGCWCVCKE